LDRTTVGPVNNNPFKWAHAQRVAVDLLKSPRGAFLAGPEAVNHAFEDLKKHLLRLIAGSRAAVSEALVELAPETIVDQAEAQLFKGKADAYWRAFQVRHAAVAAEAHERQDGPINRAFKAGYERQVRKLSGLSTVS
jgi:predicted component of type VI protein secretion system